MTEVPVADALLATAVAEDPQVGVWFTSRAFGNLSQTLAGPGEDARAGVDARRRDLAARIGAPAGGLVFMQQVHGRDVAVIERSALPDGGVTAVPAVDALVSTDPDVGLVALVADCAPVLLVAPGRGVAAAHAGRRGLVAGVIPRTVAALCEAADADAAQLVAVVGPAIGGCCYELPEALVAEVSAAVPGAAATTRAGRSGVDLAGAVEGELTAAGVGRVARSAGCTRCSPEHWFSHRADGDGPRAGRQAGIVLRSAGGDAPGGRGRPPRLGGT